MRRVDTLLASLLALVLLTTASDGLRATQGPPGNSNGATATAPRIVVRENIAVRMRDGVELAANLFLPAAEGSFPTVIVRTPYGKGDGDDDDGKRLAEGGFAMLIQDCRGTGRSDGEWTPMMHEGKDGADTLEWVRAQRWCDGRVGTSGGSYVGFTQWILAPGAGSKIDAMFTIVPMFDMYQTTYIGGAMQIGTVLSWGTEMVHPKRGEFSPSDREGWSWDRAFRTLPLSEWDRALGQRVDYIRDWVAHPVYGEYWAPARMIDRIGDIETANVTVSGWFDLFLKQALDQIPAIRKAARSERARRHQHLIIGPWGHDVNHSPGELEFGESSRIDLGEIQSRWYERWLKGEKNEVDRWPAYRMFVMGRNEWRDENEWPLARTEYIRYYLHSQGGANTAAGDGGLDRKPPGTEPPDAYVYDPENPVPTHGGFNLFLPAGPLDQREIEKRRDVLVFTSEALEEDTEVTGPVKAVLWAASSARDTDWTAKLVDVHADGRAMNVCDGILRARYRESRARPTLIEPGKAYRYEIDLWSTSLVFLRGHRIRVEISSSSFPRFDRNPNTGHPFGKDAKLLKAEQTVYHDRERPSSIVLPVIPASKN